MIGIEFMGWCLVGNRGPVPVGRQRGIWAEATARRLVLTNGGPVHSADASDSHASIPVLGQGPRTEEPANQGARYPARGEKLTTDCVQSPPTPEVVARESDSIRSKLC